MQQLLLSCLNSDTGAALKFFYEAMSASPTTAPLALQLCAHLADLLRRSGIAYDDCLDPDGSRVQSPWAVTVRGEAGGTGRRETSFSQRVVVELCEMLNTSDFPVEV